VGGCKKNLHILSLPKDSYLSLCIAHMYNANRNAFLMLNFDLITKKFKKTISSINTFPGSIFLSSFSLSEYFIGYKTILQNIPIGTIVHSISSNYKSKYGTSAGSFCQLLEIKKNAN
jgi:ribosomal protein L2